jgi:hypothetical protein
MRRSPEQEKVCDDIYAKSELIEGQVRTEGDKAKEEKDAIADVLKTRLEYADQCAKVYRTTSNKKVSDVTVNESEQIKECRSSDLYPPQK